MRSIFVVEGMHDYNRLKEVNPSFDILITNGAAISNELLDQLERLAIEHDIILFFDADNAGERLRRIISKRVPTVRHAFIKKEDSMSKNLKKVGVEHASISIIEQALQDIKSPKETSDLTNDMLIDFGLIGDYNASIRRLYLCEQLGIGYVNGKGLLKRLLLFGYHQKDIEEVLDGFKQT